MVSLKPAWVIEWDLVGWPEAKKGLKHVWNPRPRAAEFDCSLSCLGINRLQHQQAEADKLPQREHAPVHITTDMLMVTRNGCCLSDHWNLLGWPYFSMWLYEFPSSEPCFFWVCKWSTLNILATTNNIPAMDPMGHSSWGITVPCPPNKWAIFWHSPRGVLSHCSEYPPQPHHPHHHCIRLVSAQ